MLTQLKKDKYVFHDFTGRWDETKRNWEDRTAGEGQDSSAGLSYVWQSSEDWKCGSNITDMSSIYLKLDIFMLFGVQ